MSALPYPEQLTAPLGQPDGLGQKKTAGQPETAYTPAGVPVLRFEWGEGARLHLVTVTHAGERRHTYVIGSPARLVHFAGGVLRLKVSAEVVNAVDPALAPIEVEGECSS
ncbi:MAG: hypothetical protein IT317_13695 [Anaerolineales bacterium]|nr:hypothetical protein [Anaerolineales bacterium]